VKKIFDSFWQRFANVEEQAVALDEHTIALRTLKLQADASRDEITRSYRELASRYHPDRGGDTEKFIDIRRAYELLRVQSRV